MDIKVYGTETSGHQMVISLIKEFLQKAHIPCDIVEVTEVATFIEKGVESVPAIQMGDQAIVGLKSNGSFNKSLRKAIGTILESQNYGDLEKILVPVDFSDASINALVFAHRLSTDVGAVTKALHVYRPSPKVGQEASELAIMTQQDAREYLAAIVDTLDSDWGSDLLKASFIADDFRVGFATECINNAIEDDAAELVVMGTTGVSGPLAKLLGSVSTDILSQASCSVLLVPPQTRYHGLRRVVYGYSDLSKEAKSIHRLANLCHCFSAELHFVHVDSQSHQPDITALYNVVGDSYDHKLLRIKSMNNSNTALALYEYADKIDADMIAIADSKKSTFAKVLHGSVSDQMVHMLDKPLLTLK